jgi:hypothetical protein
VAKRKRKAAIEITGPNVGLAEPRHVTLRGIRSQAAKLLGMIMACDAYRQESFIAAGSVCITVDQAAEAGVTQSCLYVTVRLADESIRFDKLAGVSYGA